MKGKRTLENKAETSRKGGEGKQEMMVLKLGGEWGQGELMWHSPLGQNSHWNCYQTWPGRGGEVESRWESKGRWAGVSADLQPPKLLREVFPKEVSPAAHRHYFTCPRALSIAFSLGHTTPCLCVKLVPCVYESAPRLTISNQFLQVIPNYTLPVTAHRKLTKPLPSIKHNFCLLRGKWGRQKTKSSTFPLAAAWLWGTASPSCPRFERFGAERARLCRKFTACNKAAEDMRWWPRLPLKPWAFRSLQTSFITKECITDLITIFIIALISNRTSFCYRSQLRKPISTWIKPSQIR